MPLMVLMVLTLAVTLGHFQHWGGFQEKPMSKKNMNSTLNFFIQSYNNNSNDTYLFRVQKLLRSQMQVRVWVLWQPSSPLPGPPDHNKALVSLLGCQGTVSQVGKHLPSERACLWAVFVFAPLKASFGKSRLSLPLPLPNSSFSCPRSGWCNPRLDFCVAHTLGITQRVLFSLWEGVDGEGRKVGDRGRPEAQWLRGHLECLHVIVETPGLKLTPRSASCSRGGSSNEWLRSLAPCPPRGAPACSWAPASRLRSGCCGHSWGVNHT